jgi:ketosteroid isomerase-like protein
VSKIPRFAAYAAAFEKSYASDDWSLVEPFFTEDAVYEVGLEPPMGGSFEGRDQILAYFKQVLDRFDRRFASREIALLEGPKETGDSVWIRGSATYEAPGVPNLVLVLKEIIRFEGDQICHLEDQYEPAMQKEIAEYLQAHGEKLGIVAE